jgi:RHS repeat-associated protein
VLSRRQLRYDDNGRVGSVADARWGTTEYRYDVLGQLVEATRGKHREVFDYDVTGGLHNILKSLADVDRVHPFHTREGDLLIETPAAHYENDGQGRRTKRIDKATGEATEYVWDCRGRLREVRLPDRRRVLFTYDAFGRRVRKEVVPAERRDVARMVVLAFEKGVHALPPIGVIEYLWDGNALAGELDPMRGPRFFVHEPGTLIPMLQQEQGEVFTYINDHLGMPKELVDEDGRVAWAAAQSAWGCVVETWRDAQAKREVDTPFRLLGQYLDEETGLCYTRFRYFDPGVGRWLSPDPLGVAGGRNLFAFEGSPTADVDPWGLCTEAPEARGIQLRKKVFDYLAEKLGITRRELTKDNEVFLHGTSSEALEGGEFNYKNDRKLFTTPDPEMAEDFANRTVAKRGGDPVVAGFVVPREDMPLLRREGAFTKPVDDRPRQMETIFPKGSSLGDKSYGPYVLPPDIWK